MKLVVDASVAVKWFLPDSPREPDTDLAAALLRAVGEGRVELLQPPHWLARLVTADRKPRGSSQLETVW